MPRGQIVNQGTAAPNGTVAADHSKKQCPEPETSLEEACAAQTWAYTYMSEAVRRLIVAVGGT